MPFEGDSPPLPANTEAEQALLGAIFVSNDAYHRVTEIVAAAHFWNPVHGRIFDAIGTLLDRGVPANPVTLKNTFDQDEALTKLGGAGYLARLAESAVTVINAPWYAEAIRDAWRMRQLIVVAADLDRDARSGALKTTPAQLAERTETTLTEILSRGNGAATGDGLRSAVEAADAALSRPQGGAKAAGVPSGIEALDALTGGWQRGDLIYIGKRPSMGGTAFAVTLALNAARAGMAVAFWSVEMSAERIARRMLAWLTGISTRDQRTDAFGPGDAEALVAAREELRHYRLMIDATAPIGVSTLRRRARQAQRRGELELVLIDYLQLLRPGDGHDDVPLRDAVPRVSGQLRDLAKELDVPIVALSQLGRDVEHRENKRPMLSDLRWGGELDQDAAVVAMLYREEYYLAQAEPQGGGDPIKADKLHAEWSHALANSRGRAEIGVVKNRDDPVGIARVGFDPVRSHFFDNQNQGRLW